MRLPLPPFLTVIKLFQFLKFKDRNSFSKSFIYSLLQRFNQFDRSSEGSLQLKLSKACSKPEECCNKEYIKPLESLSISKIVTMNKDESFNHKFVVAIKVSFPF